MLTWNQETKDFYVGRLEWAAENGMLKQGQWLDEKIEKEGVFCGCMHGVSTQLDYDVIAESADAMQWPLWLSYLTEQVFEELEGSECNQFAVDVAKAVPVDADISKVRNVIEVKRLKRLIELQKNSDYKDKEIVVSAIQDVIDLWESDCKDESSWFAAKYSAELAVESAVRGARLAKSAAESAVRSDKSSSESASESASWKEEAKNLISALKSA